MDEREVKRIILAMAIYADIEAAKAENTYWVAAGGTAPYREDYFQCKADDLRQLAHRHRDEI